MANFEHEQRYWSQGLEVVAGLDEAGRGPLAGPVVAAAVVLPRDKSYPFIDDSKALTPKKREEAYQRLIQDKSVYYGVGIVMHNVIDRINILQATFEAFKLAIDHLTLNPNALLFDGPYFPELPLPQEGIVKGDRESLSIAAASIIAKVVRDEMMREYHNKWPEFDFATHKGYATKAHLEAIRTYGASPIHRMSFEPLKTLFSTKELLEKPVAEK
ncbi:MAG: ribonuclease HII [Simkaniaceae bacterium]